MISAVTIGALIGAFICFVVYVIGSCVTLTATAHPNGAPAIAKDAMAKGAAAGATAQDYTKLLEAAAKLTDSLSKAGPTLISLIGALMFLLIAAINNGAFKPAGAATTSIIAAPAGP